MLTGKMVRVRYARDRIVPHYIDVRDASWLEVAERLVEIFRAAEGRARSELENELLESFGDDPGQLVHQGLAKLLEDRCEFEVVSGQPPEKVREVVFRLAAAARQGPADAGKGFDRAPVLEQAAAELGMTPEAIEQGLFADLKSEQRLVKFSETTAERLLQRYNVALAQAVLLRSTRVHVVLRDEPPQRLRQLLRQAKFHRLVCEVERSGPDTLTLHLDGPMSLFASTQKYGLQLALFLPSVLLCRDWEIRAELRWGAQRKPRQFRLSPADGLVSHLPDAGSYVPPEMGMFAELFRKRIAEWELSEATEVLPLGDGLWVPDFRLTHRQSGEVVHLEVLGFWRRSSAEAHLARLRQHAETPFLLAVSDQLRIDDGELADLPAGIHRFRNMPLPDEVARLADELLKGRPRLPGGAEEVPPGRRG
jgi:predicted nuclease of restriction endonuclease-like RecB superfamily